MSGSTKHSDPSSAVIVTVNSGSTSVKLAAFQGGEASDPKPIAHASLTAKHGPPAEELKAFLANLPAPATAMAHRVVHGGRRFTRPVKIDSGVSAAIQELSELAPLHNPQ